jgi:hypothetical protein
VTVTLPSGFKQIFAMPTSTAATAANFSDCTGSLLELIAGADLTTAIASMEDD